ncbi:probable short-chain dehydrogenase involved in D-alanine esterification of lipoteichoic acid and wall teichoic acid (D-alanine transfer protein) [Phialocephala subalpina]|uniref:Probable short-chain dehydrogenase involved in D-alanine esterification of lipoteichoic acid and wall teichoic acid (D-alanine transfer protein) n=1 Tax=Phialocephala subalpina TaxID=576137 RepID=A0A1L7WJQ9_9HELO|nr:probable short-chain dehydrogenase involved in D-alanine esterification of lipoteichoic acid and wall teichoic acid (D-alanine transfer protein) [Phialocephala subalpina]
MSFPYKNVLVLGATSGIGLALAERMIENGIHVIAVGRRKGNLDDLQKKHGKDVISTIQFDITDLKSIPSFVENVTKQHKGLDCVFLNSGIQRKIDFTKPESIDLDLVGTELTTNYTSYIHLIKYFLPHLQRLSSPTSLIFTTSGLALIPILRCPNYCASKAAMHHLILTLREQLRGTNVKVIEVLPPAVQTELHDEKHQPDIKDGRNFGMPLKEFTNEAWAGLSQGLEDVPVGMSKASYDSWEAERRSKFEGIVKQMGGWK